MLIQCLWRCYAADKSFRSEATWHIHVKDSDTNQNTTSLASTVLPTQLGKVSFVCILLKCLVYALFFILNNFAGMFYIIHFIGNIY